MPFHRMGKDMADFGLGKYILREIKKGIFSLHHCGIFQFELQFIGITKKSFMHYQMKIMIKEKKEGESEKGTMEEEEKRTR